MGLAEDSPPLAWGALLSSIVKFSNGRLDPQYRDHSTAIDLLHDSPSLLDVLKEAWRKKSYRKIVKMGESPLSSTFFSAAHGCNRNAPVTKFIKIRERYAVLQLGVDCLKQRACLSDGDSTPGWLYQAFYQPYRGNAVDAFYGYLEANDKRFTDPDLPSHYARFCSIVQSSGTGKSRLMIEVTTNVYIFVCTVLTSVQLRQKDIIVLYMNLRSVDDKTGFPPRDRIPASTLTENIGHSDTKYHSRCCAFFTAIFMVLLDELLDLFSISKDVKQVAGLWNEGLCTISSDARYKFFGRLESVCQGLSCGESADDSQVYFDIIANTPDSNTTAVKRAYTRMVDSLPQLFKADHRPKVVITFDEAHTLNRMDGFQPSTILCSVISAYSHFNLMSDHAVWVVFVSTTLKIADFAARCDRRAFSLSVSTNHLVLICSDR